MADRQDPISSPLPRLKPGTCCYRINSGSTSPCLDGEGRIWQADQLYLMQDVVEVAPPKSGEWWTLCANIAVREARLPRYPETLSALLGTECVNVRASHFALPEGVYTVTLIVAETFESLGSFDRSFRIAFNDRARPETIHPFKVAGGFARAGSVTFTGVPVGRAGLRIDFLGDRANLFGLEIHVDQPDAAPEIRQESLAPYCPPAPPPPRPEARQLRFFFIGHSGLFFWAIPETVIRMLAFGHPEWSIAHDNYFAGGKDVAFYAQSPEVETQLQTGNYDYAVIMDSSWGPIEHRPIFESEMPRLIDRVRDAGAKPILYAYNGPKRFTIEQRASLQDAYDRLGEREQIPVIPCAAALNRALEKWPNENFHNPDRHHVGMLTGYLFACTWYRALAGESAANLPEQALLNGHVRMPEPWGTELAAIADATSCERGLGMNPKQGLLSE